MKIEITKTAGFCMGVRRAVELTLKALKQQKSQVWTYGSLIHNPQVLSFLTKKGVLVLKDIPDRGFGTVIIRAHGVSPEIEKKLRLAGFHVIDATCPRVARVQRIIKTNYNNGCSIIIVGDKNHPEVAGLIGYAASDVYVVCNISEIKALPVFEKAIIVAQTTQNVEFYEKIKKCIAKKYQSYKIFNTICNSTEKRQLEIKSLANRVDVVVVVGGKKSGNTRRLKSVAETSGKPVLHVETELELFLHNSLFLSKKIGITAGASTPQWIIKRVYRVLEQITSSI